MENQIVKINLALILFTNPQIQTFVFCNIVAIDVDDASANFTDEMRVGSDVAVQPVLAVDNADTDDAAFFLKTVDIAVYRSKAQIRVDGLQSLIDPIRSGMNFGRTDRLINGFPFAAVVLTLFHF